MGLQSNYTVLQSKGEGSLKSVASSEPINAQGQKPYSSPDTPSSPDDDLSMFLQYTLRDKVLVWLGSA